MRLNHAAVFVGDLEGTRRFYETYFGGSSSAGYHNPHTGLRAYFLTFDGSARIEILALPDISEAPQARQRGWNHIAFRIGSQRAVNELTSRLEGDGHRVISGPRTSGSGDYVAVALDPEGNQIELMA